MPCWIALHVHLRGRAGALLLRRVRARLYPGTPLDQYTQADLDREYLTEKSCAPYCTVSCVHYVSYFDFWRGEQTLKSPVSAGDRSQPLVKIQGASATVAIHRT